MAEERYRVAAGSAGAELREQGSRFLAHVGAVDDEEAAQAVVAAMAARHGGATHTCWAWRLGVPARERWCDAGEPAGTAGMPMLRVLRGAEISDVVAVVARWFGGVKLGKGGLARAYAGIVRQALTALETRERLLYETLELALPYDRLGSLQRLIHPPEIELVDADYGEAVRCRVRVLPSRRRDLLAALAAAGVANSDASD